MRPSSLLFVQKPGVDSWIQSLTLVLHEWLNATTTLLGPQLSVIEMCQATNIEIVHRSIVKTIRVEAFGSGTVIVPRFDVEVNKTTDVDLIGSIREHLANGNDGTSFRIVCGPKEILSTHPAKELLTKVFDLMRHSTVHVVNVVTPDKALMAVFRATGGRGWTRNHGWGHANIPLHKWDGVFVDSHKFLSGLELGANHLKGNRTAYEEIHLALTRIERCALASPVTNVGKLCSEVGKLSSLTTLSLTCNALSGTFPGRYVVACILGR